MVKTFTFVSFLSICISVRLFAQLPGHDVSQEKRFVMQFRTEDQRKVLGIEIIIAKPGDEGRSPMELLQRRAGSKWSEFVRGAVYRFDLASLKWEFVLGRQLDTTETVVPGEGVTGRHGLRISELQSGDVIICRRIPAYVR